MRPAEHFSCRGAPTDGAPGQRSASRSGPATAAVIGALLVGCAGPPTRVVGPEPTEEPAVTATEEHGPTSDADLPPTGSQPGGGDSSSGAPGTTSTEEEPLPPPRRSPSVATAQLPGDGTVVADEARGYHCVQYRWFPEGGALPDGVVVRVTEVVLHPPNLAVVAGGCGNDAPGCLGAELRGPSPGCEVLLEPLDRARGDAVVSLEGTVYCDDARSAGCLAVRAEVLDGKDAALLVTPLPETGTEAEQPDPDVPADDAPSDDGEPGQGGSDVPPEEAPAGTEPDLDVTDPLPDLDLERVPSAGG